MNRKYILIFFFVVFGCGIVVGILTFSTGIRSLAFETKGKRNVKMKNFILKKVKKIENSVFYEIKSCDGKNYVRDGKNNTLYSFDENLELKRIELKTKFKNIQIRAFRPFNDRLTFFDYQHQTIYVTDLLGNIFSKYEGFINRVGFIDTGRYIINLPRKSELNQGVLDFKSIDGKKERLFTVTPDVPNSVLTYGGFFIEDEERIFYLTNYYNELYLLLNSGKSVNNYKTVEKDVLIPEIKNDANGVKLFGPKTVLLNVSGATDRNFLYVISRYEKDNYHWIIDCYDKYSCKYSFSFLPPNELKDEILQGILVKDNVMYFSTINKIYLFRINR